MSWMIAGTAAACAWATAARADQCAVIDDATAARAVEALDRHPVLVSYCEPCGDVAPQPPVRAARATTHRIAGGVEVMVDGRPIDLAYAYVQTSSHRYENLAALVACPTTEVSPSLAIDDATSTGVLIHADATPVRHAEPIAPAAMPPAAPPPAPAMAIYIVAPVSRTGIGWDAVGGACGATLAVWWLGAAGVRRRRRAMRPRATEL